MHAFLQGSRQSSVYPFLYVSFFFPSQESYHNVSEENIDTMAQAFSPLSYPASHVDEGCDMSLWVQFEWPRYCAWACRGSSVVGTPTTRLEKPSWPRGPTTFRNRIDALST
jgi:hypothetical protein